MESYTEASKDYNYLIFTQFSYILLTLLLCFGLFTLSSSNVAAAQKQTRNSTSRFRFKRKATSRFKSTIATVSRHRSNGVWNNFNANVEVEWLKRTLCVNKQSTSYRYLSFSNSIFIKANCRHSCTL